MNTDDARALSKKIYTYLKCSKSESSKSNTLPFTEMIDVGLYSKWNLDRIYPIACYIIFKSNNLLSFIVDITTV